MELLAAFFLSFIPALIYVMILYWLDRYEKEPKILVGAVFLWGAIEAGVGVYENKATPVEELINQIRNVIK